MAMTVTLIADDAAETSYTLIGTGSPWVLTEASWGNAVWDPVLTGPRGTIGPKVAASTVGNRQVALGLRLLPASVDAGVGHQRDLNYQVSLMQQLGGRIRVEHTDQTLRQYLVVYSGSAAMQNWTNRAEFAGRVDYALTFLCDPFVHGDPMEIVDGFDDTGAFTNGTWSQVYPVSPANVGSISGGFLEVDTTSIGADAIVFQRNVNGYEYEDYQVGVTFTPAYLSGLWNAIYLKYRDIDNYVYVGVFDDGGSSTLYYGYYVGGADVSLGSASLARMQVGRPYRIVANIQGNVLNWAIYRSAGDADFLQNAEAEVTDTLLSGSAKTLFGAGNAYAPAIVVAEYGGTPRIDDFRLQPFTYRGTGLKACETRFLGGTIPGDAPALMDMEVLIGDSFATPTFAACGVTKVRDRNYVENGDFETTADAVAPAGPWSKAGLTGVTGASTSILGQTDFAKYGGTSAEVVCPATANTGVYCALQGPLLAGRTYTATAYVRSTSGTTNVRIKMGAASGMTAGTAVALSSTWQAITVDYTPSFDARTTYIAIEITAATATTFQIDGVQVVESGVTPELTSQQNGRGGVAPIGILYPETSNYTYGTLTSQTVDFPTMTGWVIRAATGSIYGSYAQWLVDPLLVDPDPHTGQLSVEVWAFLTTPATLTGGYARAAVIGAIDTQWTQEYGSTGTPIAASSSNLYRLGTVNFTSQKDARQQLYVGTYWTSGSGNLDIEWVALLPSRRRFSWPTGKSATGYPTFGWGTDAVAKRLLYDGRGLAKIQGGVNAYGYASSSGHGSIFTAEPGSNMACWLITTQIPNTTAYANSNQPPLSVSFSPTPRWYQLRDA